MKYLLALLLVASAQSAAVEIRFEYQLPGVDCAGQPVEIQQVQAVLWDQPIPAQDVECPDDGVVDEIPEGAQVFEVVPDTQGVVTLNVEPGVWYVRTRARSVGGWSNLSRDLQYIVVRDVETVVETVYVEVPGSGEIPRPVRDTAYDWRCVNPDGTATNHTRQDTAIYACQTRAQQAPGQTFYIEGGRYRVVGGSQ